jgi:hypothetical protein
MSTSSRRAAATLLVAGLLAVSAVPAFGAHRGDHGAPVAPTWETSADGGHGTDEVALFATASPTTNNSVESIFVTGTAKKSPLLEAIGVRDLDVLTTAFDATTGAVRWNIRFDDGLGSDDRPVGMEVNHNNNLLYVVADAGGETVTLSYAVRDGSLAHTYRHPVATTVNDTAISVAGSWLFQAGRSSGDFHVLGYETGPHRMGIDDRPVAGEALGADMHDDYGYGNVDSWRTMVVTGRESGFGTGGDAYTAAYRIDTKAKIWEHRWASPGNRRDEGVAVEMTHVRSLGHGVAFVTGQTFHPDRGFDIWVTALDARTGAPLWSGPDGMRFFGGPELRDDVPVDIRYSDVTGTLYVTGTSDRGDPHGRDVVTIAYDGLTGEQLAVAYASGDISNGGDTPTDLTISDDGTRVFVAARVHNLLHTGGYRAGVFAYDADLNPAGTGFLAAGGAGVDRAAGVAVSLDGTRVLLGGGNDTGSTRLDHTAAAFPVAEFEPVIPEPEATDLMFTSASATTGTYDDEVDVVARLTGSDGAPLPGQPISLSVDGDALTVTTDGDGTARRTVRLGDPGAYPVTATFAGSDRLLASSASDTLEVVHRATTLSLDVAGQGANRTLTATLTDDRGRPLEERTVHFFGDGTLIGSAKTDGAGRALLAAPPRARGNDTQFTATFAGDHQHHPSSS